MPIEFTTSPTPTDDELMADPNWDERITLGERRIYVVLERLDRPTLEAIWKVARPDRDVPENDVELGYGLYEHFAGC